MKELKGAIRGALVQMCGSMTKVTDEVSLPALSGGEAAQILSAPPSVGLSAVVEAARKLEEGPFTYPALNGEAVRVYRGPIVASAAVASEACWRMTAIKVTMATRPYPENLIKWLYRLVQSVERAPLGDELDCAVMGLANDLEDFPAYLFTDANRRDVARQLIYWPTFGKLANALDKLNAPLMAEQKRLLAVVNAAGALSTSPAVPSHPVSTRETRTPEAIREVRAKVQALEDVAPRREAKRWAPLPARPLRSPQEQIAALKEWNWQKAAASTAS